MIVDHNNEETVAEVLQRGFWAAFSIYPSTKMGNARMVEILRQYGAERIIVDSACDWGISDPLGVPKTAKLALERGIPEATVRLACYGNALAAYGQSGQMQRGGLARARRRSTSARSTRATPCCAAGASPGSTAPPAPRRSSSSSPRKGARPVRQYGRQPNASLPACLNPPCYQISESIRLFFELTRYTFVCARTA